MASIAKTGLLILLCNSLIASIYAEALSPDEFKRIVLDKLGSMHGKIAGAGENPVAAVGQFPYQVSLQDWYFDEHFCSGAIISEKWILTAAQCVYGLQSVKQIKAVVGTNDLTAGTDYKIREFYVPELEKDQPNHRRDIALLKTKKKIVFNELVAPIELPKQVARVNEKGIVSGWGDSIFPRYTHHRRQPKLLRFEQTTVIPNYECSERLAAIHMARTVHEDILCTLGEDKFGLCYVDAGSPLINDERKLVAIASFGKSCALGYPDVFTSVYAHVPWISEITEQPDNQTEAHFIHPGSSKTIEHFLLSIKENTEKPNPRIDVKFDAVDEPVRHS